MLVGGGALALTRFSEETAVRENRRVATATAFLKPLRMLLPASSSLAIAGVVAIVAVVAAIEARYRLTIDEVGVVMAVTVAVGLSFVSLRTAFLTLVVLGAASLVSLAIYSAFGQGAPSGAVRGAALAAMAAPLGALLLEWRDARNPRRKATEVTATALVGAAGAYVFCAIGAVTVLHVSAAVDFWADAGAVAAHFFQIAAIVFLIAPAFMTSVGTIFGRD